MMKKIYLLTLTGLMVTGLSAQSVNKTTLSTNNATLISNSRIQVLPMNEDAERAVGDTLMYAPFYEIYVNPTDQGAFALNNEDVDGLTPYNAGTGWDTDWNFFFSLDPTDFTPFDIASPWSDSAFFGAATSWFNPAGQADNWLSFGPITVPAVGAKLSWRVRTNPAYRDGYSVEVNGTGTASTDFSGTEIIYSRTDLYPNTTDAVDTVWTYYSANIPPSYNGNPVYVGFHHTANDMDVLYLDELLMVEFPTMGVDNNEFEGFGLNNVMPNPASDVAYINYQLGKTSEVSFIVTDINGKAVATLYQGKKDMGTYTYPLSVNEMNSGIYFVTLKAGNFSSTKKLVVSK